MIKRIVLAAIAVGTVATGISIAGPLDRMIYPAPTAPVTLDGLPATARIVSVTTADKLTLKGVVVPPQGDMPVLLFFHGNASSADGTVRHLAPLIAKGYGIVAAGYRGYSGNPGRPDEPGLAKDADAFAALARSEGGCNPLWLVGHSLGGGVALGIAQRQRFDLVLTIATFSRLRAMAPGIARGLMPDAYRNAAAIATLTSPYIIIHGTDDAVVPLAMGGELHRAATTAGIAGAGFILHGASHRPGATDLLSVFEAVRGWRGTGIFDDAVLPPTIKRAPFVAAPAVATPPTP